MARALKFDTVLALVVLFLLLFGLIMITSIGVPKSITLSAPGVLYPSCSDPTVDCYLLFKKHLFRLGVGLVAFLVAFKLPIRYWRRFSTPLFVFTIFALMAVLIFGTTYSTIAKNWITLLNTSVQPSEFAKLGIILYLANWLTKRKQQLSDFKEGFIPFCIISGLVIVPVILGNDFGGTFVIALICVTMYFIAGASVRHLALGFLVAFVGAIFVVSTVPHVRERFQGFMRVDEECIEDYCWQSQQANIAVGSGGFWGKGLTQGVQKSYWLPQASDDFIFAASAEELGFLRIIFVVAAYFLIGLRGYSISSRADSSFETYAAIGLTTWIVFQAFINMAVNTALLPVTGLTLPFVSYGGSSLVASLIAVGLLLNISQNTTYASSSNRRWDRGSHYTKYSHYRRS